MVELERGRMEIQEAKLEEKSKWNKFVLESPYGSFLQSWEWGDFQESLGNKVFRIKITDEGKIVAAMLLIKNRLPKNFSWLYSPRGPVWGFQNWDVKIGHQLRTYLEHIAKQENAIFLKIEPKIENHPAPKIPEKFVKSDSIQPKDTLILNIDKPEEEILSEMYSKTRYNLRLSEKKEVVVRISENSRQDIDTLYEILKETGQKNKIKIFPPNHYQKLVKILGESNIVKILFAEYKHKPIAAVIISFFGDTATYLHGGSLYNFRKLMAPHLLQWQAILEAKKRNCKFYDFWGIAPEDKPNHKWAGITRFKKGFGGRAVDYAGSFDLIYQPIWYKLYRAGTFFRRI